MAGLSAGLLAGPAAPASAAAPLDLETATVAQLDAAMADGSTTSVALTRGYLARIKALSVNGPSLNAVQVVNPDALKEAAAADAARRAGRTGSLLGVPVLLKDNIDVKGLPTTAGSLALAGNVAPADAPLVTTLRAAGAVVLGKTKLTEFANFLTSGMPAGYSSLGGQVLNAYDVTQTPSGSSAGSGVAASVGLAALTVGTETSGSILSPANANSDVGIKPTLGLVPRTGIIPISASQDTAGPIVRTVADAAALLDGITSSDPADAATRGNPLIGHDFLGDLSTTALQGARIGVVAGQAPATATAGTAPGDTAVLFADALAALRAQGATVVENVVLQPAPASPTVPVGTPSVLTYEFKRDLNSYLATRTAPGFGIRTLADVIAFNDAHPQDTLKFGQTQALASQRTDTAGQADAVALQRQRDLAASRGRLDATFANGTPDDPSDDFTALLYVGSGSAGIGAQAGYPTVLVPAGYTSGQGAASVGADPAGNRRPFSIAFLGRAYSEPTLLGLASDYEAATQLRRAPSVLNPTLFRCTDLPGSPQVGCPSTAVAPDTPAAVRAAAKDRALTVSFSAPDDGGSPVTGYTVAATPTVGTAVSTTTTGTSATLTGLVNGTAYRVTVTARNAVGASLPSAPVTATPSAGPYRLRIDPASVRVHAGSTVPLRVRVVQADGTSVAGTRVAVYTRAAGARSFVLSRTTTTGADGLALATFTPRSDFRWYATALGAVSSPGLVQVR